MLVINCLPNIIDKKNTEEKTNCYIQYKRADITLRNVMSRISCQSKAVVNFTPYMAIFARPKGEKTFERAERPTKKNLVGRLR